MAKALPRKWFVNEYSSRIRLAKVDRWADYYQKARGNYYFDTWEEAKAYLEGKARQKLKKALSDVASAAGNIERISKLTKPD